MYRCISLTWTTPTTWLLTLDLNWRALREQLERQGADESVIAEIEYAVMNLRPPIGRGGRAVVAGATGVVLNEHLLRPAAEPVVRVSELPYIVPILEHGFEHPTISWWWSTHRAPSSPLTAVPHGRSEDGRGWQLPRA